MKRSVLLLSVALALIAVFSLASIASAQQEGQGGRPTFFGGGFGGGWFGGGGFGGAELLSNEQVQKELELVDDQVQKLEQVRDDFRDQMREMFSGLRELSEADRQTRFAEIREKMQGQTEQMQAKVDEILLPHQRDRLKQLTLQLQLRRGGTSNALTNDRVAETLGLSEEQKTRLREVQEKVENNLREKIEQLRNEGRDEVLKVLTPEQQAKWKEMIGDSFELQDGGGYRGRFGGRNDGNDRPSTDNP